MNECALADKKIIIASYMHVMNDEFTTLGGPALALRNYLKTRTVKLTCIWQPLPISDTLDVIAEVYRNDSRKVYHMPMLNWPWNREGGINFLYVALKPRDILADIYFGLRLRDCYDYWIGVEALNALAGAVLKRTGIVTRVIYYNLDYGEARFKNKFLNWIFHTLDRLAARYADVVWNLSPEMARTRNRLTHNRLKFAPQLTVPIGTDVERVQRLPFEQIDRYAIVYLGLLSENTGAGLVLEAMPILARTVPEAKLLIIGSGPLESAMRIRAAQLGLSATVKFLGRVSDAVVEETLRCSAVGIAPYPPDSNSIKKFTDVTKPRMYMVCGLPVIITDVPPVAKEIAQNRAGFVIDYDKEALSTAMVRLLTDEELLKEFRQNAVNLAFKYGWVDIFSRAFSETKSLLGE